MSYRRLNMAVMLAVTFIVGVFLAFTTSRLYLWRPGFGGSYSYHLLFKAAPWAVLVAAAAGFFSGASVSDREESKIENGRVLRHDAVFFMQHWIHALATVLLLLTGVALGFLFIPRLVKGTANVGFMFNLHFVGVLLFMFAVCHYVADLMVNGGFQEHLPASGDLQQAVNHYLAMFSGKEPAPEGKFLASERLAYLGFVVDVLGIVLTGCIKVAAHAFSLPGVVMGPITFLHDLAALGMLGMLAAHVFFSSLVPWSWPLMGSMLTGYVPEAYAREHHAKWFEELRRGGQEQPSTKPVPGKGKGVPAIQ